MDEDTVVWLIQQLYFTLKLVCKAERIPKPFTEVVAERDFSPGSLRDSSKVWRAELKLRLCCVLLGSSGMGFQMGSVLLSSR
jgi:hypothetical protein